MEKRMEVDYVKAVSQFDKAIKKFEDNLQESFQSQGAGV